MAGFVDFDDSSIDIATFGPQEFSESKFSPSSLVNKLTASHLKDVKGKDDIDSDLFHEVFQEGIQQLGQLRAQEDAQIKKLAAEAKEATEKHKKNVANYHKTLDSLALKVRILENTLSSASHSAVRLSYTLNNLDKGKFLCIEGKEIIRHYLTFAEGDVSKLDPLFRRIMNVDPPEAEDSKEDGAEGNEDGSLEEEDGSGEALHRAARLVQFMSQIADNVRVKGTDKAARLIAAASSTLENKLLDCFTRASQRGAEGQKGGDMALMQRCASTLFNFTGRAVVKRYVGQAVQQLDAMQKELDSSQRRVNVKAFRNNLRDFYKKVKEVIEAEAHRIAVVFEQPVGVFVELLIFVFEVKLADFLENALQPAKERSAGDAYLRMLHAAYTQTIQLVGELDALLQPASSPFTRPASAPGSPNTSNGHGSGAAGGGGAHQAISGAINLKEYAVNLFTAHKEAHLDREVHWLQEAMRTAVDAVQSSADQAGGEARQAGEQAGDGAAPTRKNNLAARANRLLHGKDKAGGMAAAQATIVRMLHHTLFDQLLGFLNSSVTRCVALSDPGRLPEHLERLASLWLSGAFDGLLSAQVVQAAHAAETDPQSEPDAFFFKVVGWVATSGLDAQALFEEAILPRMAASGNSRTIAQTRLWEAVESVEGLILQGLSNTLGAAIQWVGRLLGKQKSSTYKPKDDSLITADLDADEAIELLEDFVDRHVAVATHSLQGANRDDYLTIFGIQAHAAIVDHLKKMQVSDLGAGFLARDLKTLAACFGACRLPPVTQRFGQLLSMADLFFVTPENLGPLLVQGSSAENKLNSKFGEIHLDTIHEFVKMRSDYAQFKTKFIELLDTLHS